MPSSSEYIKEKSAAAEFGGNHSESEIQHILICGEAVNNKDLLDKARKISDSPQKRLSIEFCDCGLTGKHLEYFCDKIKEEHGQITTFTISYMDSIDDLLEKTCFIVREYETRSLSFEYDELNDKSLALIQRYLEDEKMSTKEPKIEFLDISYNKKISAVGFERLGSIMSKFNIGSLKATACDITDEKLKRYLNALNGIDLKEFNIGRNDQLTGEGFETLAKYISKKGIGRLELSGCGLSEENIYVFCNSLSLNGNKSILQELDVSYNSTIVPDTLLGSVVIKCGVTELSMAGCKLSNEHVRCFRDSMKNHKMKLINLRDNASISNGIDEVARLVRQCEVRELNICDCLFSAAELECFRRTLRGVKVSFLHLGDQGREPDEKYIEKMCALMPSVEDILYLRFHKLSSEFRLSLQESCGDSVKIILTVSDRSEELCRNERKGTDESSVEEGSPTLSEFEKSPFETLEEGAMEQQASKDAAKASKDAAEKRHLSVTTESAIDESSLKKQSLTSQKNDGQNPSSSLKTAMEQQASNEAPKKRKLSASSESMGDQSSLEKDSLTLTKYDEQNSASLWKKESEQQASNEAPRKRKLMILSDTLESPTTEQQASKEAAEREKVPALPESIEDQSLLKKEPSTSSELDTISVKTALAMEQQESNEAPQKGKLSAFPESIEDQSALEKGSSTSSKLETSSLETATEQQPSNEAAEKEKLPASPDSIEDQSSLKKEPSTSTESETSSFTGTSLASSTVRSTECENETTATGGLSSSHNALETFLSKNEYLAEEDKIKLLQRIGYCLMRLHSKESSCDESSHSQIFILRNSFSPSTTNRRNSESTRQTDIQSLANLYCYILTNRKISEYSEGISVKDLDCSFPDVALNIIEKMATSETLTIQEVMRHPFHWDDLRKVLFLCRAVDYISARHKNLAKKSVESRRAILKMYNMGDEVNVVSEKGWIEQMRLSTHAVKKLLQRQKKYRMRHCARITRNSIYSLALKVRRIGEKRERSVYELLRFFRSRYLHLHEDPSHVHLCFGSYPAGYLRFFTSRFPKLFMHVYDNTKIYLLHGLPRTEEFKVSYPTNLHLL